MVDNVKFWLELFLDWPIPSYNLFIIPIFSLVFHLDQPIPSINNLDYCVIRTSFPCVTFFGWRILTVFGQDIEGSLDHKHELIGGYLPRKMMDFVSWDDHSQLLIYIYGKIKIMFQTTNQYIYIYIYLYMENIDYSHCMEKHNKFQSINQWRFIGMIHEPPPSSECTRWYSYMIYYVLTVLDNMWQVLNQSAPAISMLYPSAVMKKSLLDHNEPTWHPWKKTR